MLEPTGVGCTPEYAANRDAAGEVLPVTTGGWLPTTIVIAAALLRLYRLDAYPDWFHDDHSVIGADALHLTLPTLMQRFHSVGGPWMALTTGLLWLLGPHLWVLRVTAAVSGTLTVGIVYLLGREIDDYTGIFAAALCATSPPLVLLSRLPYVMEPVGPMLCGFYFVLRGWQSRRIWWWAASGFLTGYTLWGYWGAGLWVPVYAASLAVIATLRPRELWERRWLLCAWGACWVLTSPALWAAVTAGTDHMGRTLLTLATWDIPTWRFQIRQVFGALVYSRDAGAWGSWASRAALPWPECAFLTLALLVAPVRGRMLLLLSVVAIIVVLLCGAVLLPDPADCYHLLPVVLPFLMLLAGAGAARLKWVGIPCVGAIVVLHLTLLWAVLGPTTASATNAAVRWIADHRAVRCVTLLRRPTDEAPGGPVYAFVRDVPIIDGGDCPAVIAFPGRQAPPRRDGRWTVLRSVDGPVVIWEAP